MTIRMWNFRQTCIIVEMQGVLWFTIFRISLFFSAFQNSILPIIYICAIITITDGTSPKSVILWTFSASNSRGWGGRSGKGCYALKQCGKTNCECQFEAAKKWQHYSCRSKFSFRILEKKRRRSSLVRQSMNPASGAIWCTMPTLKIGNISCVKVHCLVYCQVHHPWNPLNTRNRILTSG